MIVHGSHNLSGHGEWYTPAKYVEAARDVMGSIDTDPASSELAQKVIRAETYYTIEDNGLTQPWHGNVWLNPPYAVKVITPFVDRLIGLWAERKISQAILLTHNNSDTSWFQKPLQVAAYVCLTRGRLRFYNENGEGDQPTHGHAFHYFGLNRDRFAETFSEFGSIVESKPFASPRSGQRELLW